MHLLKLAKILVILIKNGNSKCGLTLFEEKIIMKHMHSFKSDTTQFPRKMQALRIFYINNSFIYGKEKSTIKIIQNQSIKAVQKKIFSKPRKILKEYLYTICFLALHFSIVRCHRKKLFIINLQHSLKKLLDSLFAFYWITIISIFLFLQQKFLVLDVIILL